MRLENIRRRKAFIDEAANPLGVSIVGGDYRHADFGSASDDQPSALRAGESFA